MENKKLDLVTIKISLGTCDDAGFVVEASVKTLKKMTEWLDISDEAMSQMIDPLRKVTKKVAVDISEKIGKQTDGLPIELSEDELVTMKKLLKMVKDAKSAQGGDKHGA